MSDEPENGSSNRPPVPNASAGSEAPPEPLLLRLRSFLGGLGSKGGGRRSPWIRRGIAVVALVLLVIVGSQGVAHVGETQVGVRVNNLTGNLTAAPRVGYHVFVPYTSQFHVLDKTIQRLDLGWRQTAPGTAGRDLKLKTADGSNVSVDVVINFKLIPEKATEVLRRSGPGMRFAEAWLEPFTRQICFSAFGQLTTEEMYDAAKRNEKAQAALRELNERLNPHGIEVVTVIPGEFRFYKEYELVIQEKKLADQQVEEQQAQARAAVQDQERQLVEARKKAETKLATFQGESANRLIQAKGEADKKRREGDGRYAATLLAADTALYSAGKQSEGEKATLLAQAEGMEQMRRAMVGDGGVSMIGLEYAKHLTRIKFSATPITREPSIHQFAVEPGTLTAAAAPLMKASASPAPSPPGTPAAAGIGPARMPAPAGRGSAGAQAESPVGTEGAR